MDLNLLRDTPPWDWPKDARKTFLNLLKDRLAPPSDRLIAADLAGDFTAINDDLAHALMAVLRDGGEPEELRALGELVYAEGLASPHEAKIVRAGADGAPVIDSSFPESKEYLAGYWIVDVASVERAYAIAAYASAAPGIGGAPMNMPIEVRQVMSGPPKEFL